MFKLFYRILGCHIGKGVLFKGFPVIVCKGNVSIGDNVIVNSSFLSNLIGLYQRTVIVSRVKNSKIIIGNNVGISGVTIYARKSIIIGDNTKIGGNTKIFDNDFHPVDPQERLMSSNKNMKIKPIFIGKNVFIGCNCLILKGTQIGDNTTIGAGSVVSGTFPANCIVAGNPAKIIKFL